MIALGIDTSNYATSLAVVDASKGTVLAAQKQFLPVKQGELGLRQSDAVFQHARALPLLLDSLNSNIPLQEIHVVGASEKPRPVQGSYMPCFLAGVGFGKAFSAGANVPFYTTSHQQGHLASALFGADTPSLLSREVLFFHVSGGTTELLLTNGHQITGDVGKSMDLYAGQAIDRIGVRLGFSFPAGAALSELAETCREKVSPKISVVDTNCHLSGLQNQCERLLEDGKSPAYVACFCLTAVAKTAARMVEAARKTYPNRPVLCAGGVMASSLIRREMQADCTDIYFAPPEYSADNAIGVALIAAREASDG